MRLALREEATLTSVGQTFQHEFNTSGTYEDSCVPHAGVMTGVIRVQ